VRKATGHAWHWVFAIELCCAETNSGWISLPKGVKVHLSIGFWSEKTRVIGKGHAQL
jgi:hypothetical protein